MSRDAGDSGAGRVIGILGATGVGKTAVGVELAGLLGAKVISCDSMQVYSGFPVLTNQPLSAVDRPDLHELVGFLEPSDTISAGHYADLARPLAERDCAGGGTALLVGGTGLYMRASLAPLAAPGPGDEALRLALEKRAEREGPTALHGELAQLDPVAASSIDHRNTRRVIRALEAVLSSGQEWSGRGDLWDPMYYRPTLVIGLQLDRGLLAERIDRRTEAMLHGDAVEEVRRFCAERGADVTRPGARGICSAIGYGELWRYLAGEQGRAETVEQIAAATRRYARRQETWLRKVKDAVMIDVGGRDAGDIAAEIVRLVASVGVAKESCRP